MMTLKERIDELCKTHGSLRKAAKAVDVDFGYLSGLRSGDKTSPSETILTKLGLKRRCIMYSNDDWRFLMPILILGLISFLAGLAFSYM